MLNSADVAGSALAYLYGVPSNALAGDVFAVSTVLLLFYAFVYLVNKLTSVIILFLKKAILLVIVSLAFYQFLQFLSEKVGGEGFTQDNLILGGAGMLIGFAAFLIALNAAFSSVKESRKTPQEKEEADKEEKAGKEAAEGKSGEKVLSIDAFRGDRNLGAVLAYLIVAEFGVISSKTVAAPNVTVGVIFFAGFIVAALFFIRQSYKSYATGLRHLLAAFVIGWGLSVVLGYFWSGYALEQLFSDAYFATDAMVAFVTGIAVSLFMGSKG